ncbi:MAG: DUF2279 domain-containing protein [Chryseolinea sp.]
MAVLIKAVVLVVLLLQGVAHAQAIDSTKIYQRRLTAVSVGAAVAYGITLASLDHLWYDDKPKQSFRFFNDNSEWNQVDKLGHLYSAFYLSYTAASALRWCNLKPSKADLIGSLAGFVVMVPIELLDGFSMDYGASGGDLLANAAGSALYLGQKLWWNEVRIYPKFSFHQTHYAPKRPDILGESLPAEIFKDYNGQTYWACFDMDKFIRFPRWLNLAVGYGAEGMIYARDHQNADAGYPQSYRQYFLSIDFDLRAIKTRSKFVKGLIFVASMIKLPAPTVEFTKKGAKLHALYF